MVHRSTLPSSFVTSREICAWGFIISNSVTVPCKVTKWEVSTFPTPWCANIGPEAIRKPIAIAKATNGLSLTVMFPVFLQPLMCRCISRDDDTVLPTPFDSILRTMTFPPRWVGGARLTASTGLRDAGAFSKSCNYCQGESDKARYGDIDMVVKAIWSTIWSDMVNYAATGETR